MGGQQEQLLFAADIRGWRRLAGDRDIWRELLFFIFYGCKLKSDVESVQCTYCTVFYGTFCYDSPLYY
jgi:hypothetical protein